MWVWYIIWTVAVIALLSAYTRKPAKPRLSRQDILYRQTDSLTSQAEHAFLTTLDEVVRGRARVFCMVRVADVLRPQHSLEQSLKQTLFLKTSQKHFDFLLCDPVSLQPLCAIELSDKSPQRTGKRTGKNKRRDKSESDRFLSAACESAQLALHVVSVASQYDPQAIAELIEPTMPQSMLRHAS